MKEVFMETKEWESINDYDYQYQQYINEKMNIVRNDFHKCNLLFVYGTLMKGYHNNYFLKNEKYIATGHTKEPYYICAASIPFVFEEIKDVNIKGELYELKHAETLRYLDFLEGHPHMYKRKIISIMIKGYEQKAWIYFYQNSSIIQNSTHIKTGSFHNYKK